MQFERISESNRTALQNMFFEMWPEDGMEVHGKYVNEILHSENQHAILARDNTEFTGFVFLSMRKGFVEGVTHYPVAYVEGIYVREAFRNTGLGRKFIELAELWGSAKGSKELASDVEIENLNSQQFHEHLGFKEQNRIVCYVKTLG